MSEGLEAGDCGVCIGGDTGEYCTVSDSKIVKARKPHTCEECNGVIKPGDQYERTSMLYEGEWSRTNVCLICAEIGNVFSCDGRQIGNMWEDICENLFPAMTTGCLARLKTAAAKEYLVRKWQKWKGLQA
jgi:DnaJ-class molecular chaperone